VKDHRPGRLPIADAAPAGLDNQDLNGPGHAMRMCATEISCGGDETVVWRERLGVHRPAGRQRDLTARVERCGLHRSAIPATELTELTEHARPRRRRHHIRSHGATRIGHHASVKLPAPSLISLSMSRRHADASQNTL